MNHSIVGRRSVGRLRCKNNEDVVRSRRSRERRSRHSSIDSSIRRSRRWSLRPLVRETSSPPIARASPRDERTNESNESKRSESNPRPSGAEIRDSRFEIRASRFERRASSVERRDPHPPPRAHRLAHTHPPAHTDPASRFEIRIVVIIIQNHHSKSSHTHTPRRIAHTPRASHPTPHPPPPSRAHHPTPPPTPHPSSRVPRKFRDDTDPATTLRIPARACTARGRSRRVDRWVGGSNGRVVTRASSLPRVLTGGVRDLSSVDESHTLVCVCVCVCPAEGPRPSRA